MGIQKGGGESSWSFCEICRERKEVEEMFRIGTGCSHIFCSVCVSRHVGTKVQANVSTIKCPGLECECVLQIDSCRHVLPENIVSKWEEALCVAAILGSEAFQYCPFQDCSALMIKDDDIRECECLNCHRLFCAKCSVPWHVDLSCEEFQSQKEDLDLWELVKKKKWRACPKCKHVVERTQGCPHMTCRCSFEFCYGCGSEWSQGHGGCAEK